MAVGRSAREKRAREGTATAKALTDSMIDEEVEWIEPPGDSAEDGSNWFKVVLHPAGKEALLTMVREAEQRLDERRKQRADEPKVTRLTPRPPAPRKTRG
jgi:hypothetical protein